MVQKSLRPKLTNSRTTHMEMVCGELTVIMGFSEDDKLIEVFITLGKAGGCSNCQNEALARSVSLGLKYGIPLEEFIEELRGIRCPSKTFVEGKELLSCADAVSQVLKEYVDGTKEKM